MISRKHRFHGYNSLKYVYQHGKTVRGPLCAVKFAVNSRRSDYRLAVVVSKKVNKSAVARNRIRRRIYEIVRMQEGSIIAHDIVLTVFHESVGTLPYEELQTVILAQLRQAGIIRTQQ